MCGFWIHEKQPIEGFLQPRSTILGRGAFLAGAIGEAADSNCLACRILSPSFALFLLFFEINNNNNYAGNRCHFLPGSYVNTRKFLLAFSSGLVQECHFFCVIPGSGPAVFAQQLQADVGGM